MTDTNGTTDGADRILYCHCAYAKVVPPDVKREVLRRLGEAGVAFDAVPDLCEMSARKDPALADLVAGEGRVRIAACFPRAVRWLFHAAGVPVANERLCVQNMREATAEDVVAGVLGGTAEAAS